MLSKKGFLQEQASLWMLLSSKPLQKGLDDNKLCQSFSEAIAHYWIQGQIYATLIEIMGENKLRSSALILSAYIWHKQGMKEEDSRSKIHLGLQMVWSLDTTMLSTLPPLKMLD